jgi:hypothetical protein
MSAIQGDFHLAIDEFLAIQGHLRNANPEAALQKLRDVAMIDGYDPDADEIDDFIDALNSLLQIDVKKVPQSDVKNVFECKYVIGDGDIYVNGERENLGYGLRYALMAMIATWTESTPDHGASYTFRVSGTTCNLEERYAKIFAQVMRAGASDWDEAGKPAVCEEFTQKAFGTAWAAGSSFTLFFDRIKYDAR